MILTQYILCALTEVTDVRVRFDKSTFFGEVKNFISLSLVVLLKFLYEAIAKLGILPFYVLHYTDTTL